MRRSSHDVMMWDSRLLPRRRPFSRKHHTSNTTTTSFPHFQLSLNTFYGRHFLQKHLTTLLHTMHLPPAMATGFGQVLEASTFPTPVLLPFSSDRFSFLSPQLQPHIHITQLQLHLSHNAESPVRTHQCVLQASKAACGGGIELASQAPEDWRW